MKLNKMSRKDCIYLPVSPFEAQIGKLWGHIVKLKTTLEYSEKITESTERNHNSVRLGNL